MWIDSVSLRATIQTPETRAFWEAANEGRLLYARCSACDRPHFYPRRVCPFCLSTEVEWRDACGRATLHAFSLYHKGEPPFVSAWVMLEEGVAILSNITDCETDALRIGARVYAVFRPTEDGQLVPVFKPD